MTDMAAALDDWLAALNLDRVARGVFRGFAPPGRRRRVFGGMAMGQALVAAAHEIGGELEPLAVHCDFARAADPRQPIDFETTPTSSGSRFATCAVQARQAERVLFTLLARFHAPEGGPEFQAALSTPAPDPDTLADYPTQLAPHAAKLPDWAAGDSPIDVRMIGGDGRAGQRSWIRIGDGAASRRLAAMPVAAPVVVACGLLYAGDMTLLGAAPLPFGRAWSDDGVALASLDHAMWFHRPFDGDGWLLYEQHALSIAGARALVGGELYAADGRLVATVAQHGFARIDELIDELVDGTSATATGRVSDAIDGPQS